MQVSPSPTPGNIRVFTACLLSFAILIMPFAALAAPRSAGSATVKERSLSTATETSNKASVAREAFVNPPPQPVAPSISASMTAALVPTGNNGDGKADPNDTIIYTATITNSGSDATGVNFADTVDSHTTFVGGSLDISPLALDDGPYDTIGNTLLAV